MDDDDTDHTDEFDADEGNELHTDGTDERLDALQKKTDTAREAMIRANRRAGLRDDEPTPPTSDQLPRRR